MPLCRSRKLQAYGRRPSIAATIATPWSSQISAMTQAMRRICSKTSADATRLGIEHARVAQQHRRWRFGRQFDLDVDLFAWAVLLQWMEPHLLIAEPSALAS